MARIGTIYLLCLLRFLFCCRVAPSIHSWTFYDEDIYILKHLYKHLPVKETNIFLGVPQQMDKLAHFLNNLKIFIDDTNSKIDYVPILWDESFDYQKK